MEMVLPKYTSAERELVTIRTQGFCRNQQQTASLSRQLAAFSFFHKAIARPETLIIVGLLHVPLCRTAIVGVLRLLRASLKGVVQYVGGFLRLEGVPRDGAMRIYIGAA